MVIYWARVWWCALVSDASDVMIEGAYISLFNFLSLFDVCDVFVGVECSLFLLSMWMLMSSDGIRYVGVHEFVNEFI